MGRFKALAVGVALVAAVLAPGTAGAVTTSQVISGFLCGPNGSAVANGNVVGPTTKLSQVALFGDPSDDWLACQFNLTQNSTVRTSGATSSSIDFGGPCTFQPVYVGAGSALITPPITFEHRVYRVRGTQASLYCWDGEYLPD